MAQYRVFLGAPSTTRLKQSADKIETFQWQTISSNTSSSSTAPTNIIFPPATLEAASRRISLIYQNIIFTDADDDLGELDNGEVREKLEDFQNLQSEFTKPYPLVVYLTVTPLFALKIRQQLSRGLPQEKVAETDILSTCLLYYYLYPDRIYMELKKLKRQHLMTILTHPLLPDSLLSTYLYINLHLCLL